jgi:hypothetical protein
MEINRTGTHVLMAVALAGWVAAAAVAVAAEAQSGRDLKILTVPVDRLAPGCRLKATPPKERILLGPQGGVLVVSDEAGVVPSNPWSGSDRRIAAAIRRVVDGSPPEPDGPPLDAESRIAFALRSADNIVDAYTATYVSTDDSINVYAVRFDDEKLARPEPPAGTRSVPRGATYRAVIGPTVVLVAARTRSGCFEAISDYVRSLR